MAHRTYYHYTSTAGAQAIRSAGHIKQSGASGAFGPGVYFTTLAPENHYRDEIRTNNYGVPNRNGFNNRADNVVVIPGHRLDQSKLEHVDTNDGRIIYRYKDDVNNIQPGDVIDKPKCHRAANANKNLQTTNLVPGPVLVPTNLAQGMFYHYTSSDGAHGIQKSGVIKQSLSRGSWPTGVYLTTMEPEKHSRTDILIKMHGVVRSDNQNRADWVVLIEGKTLDLNKLVAVSNTSDVYCYRDEIRVQPDQVIDKPKCQQGAANIQHNQPSTSILNLVQGTFYHYTSSAGARGIKSAGAIRKSRQRGSWGSGVYLTKMQPEKHKREEILINIHGSFKQDIKNQADWVVVIDGRDLDSSKLEKLPFNDVGSRDVYLYRDDIQVRPGDVIDKPRCNK